MMMVMICHERLTSILKFIKNNKIDKYIIKDLRIIIGLQLEIEVDYLLLSFHNMIHLNILYPLINDLDILSQVLDLP
jgi:hypothetical protein